MASKDHQNGEAKVRDWAGASREKRPSPVGSTIFTILRLLDLPLQYYLLRSGLVPNLLRRLGGTPISTPLVTSSSTSFLGLPPYQALILTMAAGSAAKQIFWKLSISQTEFLPKFALLIAGYNTVLNTINTMLSLWALTSQQPAAVMSGSALDMLMTPANALIPVGTLLYALGIWVEWWCEVQRKSFKSHAENQDRPFSGGLFALATNINYGGYTLWRTGYAIVCGGLPWAAIQAAWVAGDFIARAIPSMDAYCRKRVSLRTIYKVDEGNHADGLQYGKQWESVRQQVPYKLLPWIY